MAVPGSSPKWRLARPRLLLLTGIALLVALSIWFARVRPVTPVGTTQTGEQAGGYAELLPEQRRLIDDWSERFGKALGRQVTAAALYSDFALSTKTTFNAVTHALRQTTLTDRAGLPLNRTALDLVARVETVAGSDPGKGGDKQFRMYVEMKPGAQETLEKCREFSRQIDNTVFHKGYPICFRGEGGTPSIQVSFSRDGKRADIDVDYRSSTFPVMLVNGHLTASNSDVRAGDNDQRHNGHWSGLRNWWRGFMGLPFFEDSRVETDVVGSQVFREPRLGKGANPEAAIRDFLNAWLVEQNPGIAVGYVSPRAFACMELDRGIAVDRGVARIRMLRAMQSINKLVGRVGDLDGAVRGVSLRSPRGEVIQQPHHGQFVMYAVSEDIAGQLDCESRLHLEQTGTQKALSSEFDEFVGAAFQLNTPRFKGEVVSTIWAKDKTGWSLVSFHAGAEVRPGAVSSGPPEVSAAPSEPLPVIDGDPAMSRAIEGFLNAWYLKKDAAAAFRYLAPSSMACYNAFRPENSPIANSTEEAGKLILDRMKLIADWAGNSTRLDELLVAPEPHHADLKLVKHGQEQAFSIVSVPDYMAAAADCAKLKPGEAIGVRSAGPNTHGRFYAASTKLKKAGPDAGVLWTLWSKQADGWKVVSYLVMTP